jgi:Transposase IS116/IS110/IS902 family
MLIGWSMTRTLPRSCLRLVSRPRCRVSASGRATARGRLCPQTGAFASNWTLSRVADSRSSAPQSPGPGTCRQGRFVLHDPRPDRLRSEASFARLCGAAPIPVSSGRTDRHRLHRGGDRQANSALWRIALVRMGCHQPAKDYVARRTAEGETKTEIMRCLKRYIAREAFPHLLSAQASVLST